MVALVACETLLLALLLLLVVGLLRSHAEVLRRLGPPGEEAEAGDSALSGEASGRLPEPGRRAGLREGHDIAGLTVARDAVKIGLVEDSPPTLLAFLSSGCAVCERFWTDLHTGRAPELPEDVRVIAVTKDASHESPSRLRGLAPDSVPLVMSSAAWQDYGVPASPYFVYLEGGRVRGEGSASNWGQIASLLRDAVADHAQHGGESRTGEVDRVLAAAGIGPGHPSLYPGRNQAGAAGRPAPGGGRVTLRAGE
jgi:hypothetical protein